MSSGIRREPQKLALKLHAGLKILRDGWKVVFFFPFYVALLKSFDKWFWRRFLFFFSAAKHDGDYNHMLEARESRFKEVCVCVCALRVQCSIDNAVLLFMHRL